MKSIFKKRFFLVVFVSFFIFVSNSFNASIYAQSKSALGESSEEDSKGIVKKLNYVPGEIVVKYKNENLDLKKTTGLLKSLSFEQKFSLAKKDEIKESNIQVFKTKKTVEDTIEELKNDPNVEYAEPNYIKNINSINTTDTYKDLLWGLDNTGQNVNGTIGAVDKDIDAPAAWNLSEGSGIIVAVIDTGVAYNHPDLINNMWDGSSCKYENGNALGGCNHGYDFENSDNTPLPDSSLHGTHVAGTIAAEKNNSKGIIGVAPQTKIMAIKFGFNIISEVKAIDFAIQNGAKVINASFSGNDFSQAEYDAINRFKATGGIFVAVAGNESTNNDSGTHSYPSDYDLDNIISVAATDQNDNLVSFSNYGVISVDVAAPGVNIYSTISSESTLFSENFDSLSAPNVPSGWVKGGVNNNFGTYYFGSVIGNALYGDLNYPYANNADTNITSSNYNLSNGGNISFSARCDTEYKTDGWYDYMALDLSSDGTNFTEFEKWDEATLDYYNSDSNSSGGAYYYFENLSIPNEYRTANFKFRFRWVTNASDNAYDGCRVDDIKFTRFSDGSDEQYGYDDGTSMAAPHVAGAVALVWSANSGLTAAQVKSNVLQSGEIVVNLANKTSSGRRINTYNSIYQSLNDDRPIYRFFNKIDGEHFYTMSSVETLGLIKNNSNVWMYEGTAYNSFPSQESSSTPLYRFWNKINGQHFYTINSGERDGLIANNSDTWVYEGIAYYVYNVSSEVTSTTVYRFWNKINGQHFYTINSGERDGLIANNSDTWVYEGNAWKVPLSN